MCRVPRSVNLGGGGGGGGIQPLLRLLPALFFMVGAAAVWDNVGCVGPVPGSQQPASEAHAGRGSAHTRGVQGAERFPPQ